MKKNWRHSIDINRSSYSFRFVHFVLLPSDFLPANVAERIALLHTNCDGINLCFRVQFDVDVVWARFWRWTCSADDSSFLFFFFFCTRVLVRVIRGPNLTWTDIYVFTRYTLPVCLTGVCACVLARANSLKHKCEPRSTWCQCYFI